MDTRNSQRFIVAYNSIDYSLRTIYDIKRSTGFSDAVRRASQTHTIVKKYEDDMLDYSRLRNSIVHSSGTLMAEPHDEVVEKIEHIARTLAAPPLAFNLGQKNKPFNIEADTEFATVIAKHYEIGFTNLPVVSGKAIIGVSNLKQIATTLAEIVSKKQSLDEFIKSVTIADILKRNEAEAAEYFVIANEKLTVSEALGLFSQNRKLACILFTKTGRRDDEPTGILTAGDVIDLNKILDEY